MKNKLIKLKDDEILTHYLNYVKLDFQKNETQSAKSISKYIALNIALMYLYKVGSDIVGWAFLTVDKKFKLAFLQYLAIFKTFRNKGYGGEFLLNLKNKLKNYNGIFLDCEAVEINNPVQEKRQQFYSNNGFIKSDLETICWDVHYNYFYIPIKNNNIKSDDLFDSLTKTFLIKHNKKYLEENFKRINNDKN